MLNQFTVKHVFFGISMFNVDVIYKICDQKEWNLATEKGVYKGSSDDLRDGFIHFSTFDQVTATLEKHFKNKNNLLLLKIAIDRLDQEALQWEVSRNNEKFPHLYGDLNLNAVISVEELPDNR